MKLQTFRTLTTTLMLTLLVAGCSGIQKNQSLVDAEGYYSKIKENEDVLRYAPAELKRAEDALREAALAQSNEDMSSLAYVATTRTQTALAVAERKVLRAQLKELSQLRSEELLKARDLEISREKDARKRAQLEREAALADAETSRLERESALAEAQTSRLKSEAALADAQTLRLEREAALADAEALRLEKVESMKAAEALRLEMQALQAVKTERGMVMTLGDVLFSTGKAALQPGAMSTIDRLSAFLAQYKEKTVLIEGHTDNIGADQYNQVLSEQRADAVRVALVELGVAPERVSTTGYGESRPLADNSTDAGRLKNRRVEIVIKD